MIQEQDPSADISGQVTVGLEVPCLTMDPVPGIDTGMDDILESSAQPNTTVDATHIQHDSISDLLMATAGQLEWFNADPKFEQPFISHQYNDIQNEMIFDNDLEIGQSSEMSPFLANSVPTIDSKNSNVDFENKSVEMDVKQAAAVLVNFDINTNEMDVDQVSIAAENPHGRRKIDMPTMELTEEISYETRTKKHKYTPQMREQIIKFYFEGYNQTEISKILVMARQTVSNVIKMLIAEGPFSAINSTKKKSKGVRQNSEIISEILPKRITRQTTAKVELDETIKSNSQDQGFLKESLDVNSKDDKSGLTIEDIFCNPAETIQEINLIPKSTAPLNVTLLFLEEEEIEPKATLNVNGQDQDQVFSKNVDFLFLPDQNAIQELPCNPKEVIHEIKSTNHIEENVTPLVLSPINSKDDKSGLTKEDIICNPAETIQEFNLMPKSTAPLNVTLLFLEEEEEEEEEPKATLNMNGQDQDQVFSNKVDFSFFPHQIAIQKLPCNPKEVIHEIDSTYHIEENVTPLVLKPIEDKHEEVDLDNENEFSINFFGNNIVAGNDLLEIYQDNNPVGRHIFQEKEPMIQAKFDREENEQLIGSGEGGNRRVQFVNNSQINSFHGSIQIFQDVGALEFINPALLTDTAYDDDEGASIDLYFEPDNSVKIKGNLVEVTEKMKSKRKKSTTTKLDNDVPPKKARKGRVKSAGSIAYEIYSLYSEEMVLEAIQLLADGFSFSTIEKELGIPEQYLKKRTHFVETEIIPDEINSLKLPSPKLSVIQVKIKCNTPVEQAVAIGSEITDSHPLVKTNLRETNTHNEADAREANELLEQLRLKYNKLKGILEPVSVSFASKTHNPKIQRKYAKYTNETSIQAWTDFKEGMKQRDVIEKYNIPSGSIKYVLKKGAELCKENFTSRRSLLASKNQSPTEKFQNHKENSHLQSLGDLKDVTHPDSEKIVDNQEPNERFDIDHSLVNQSESEILLQQISMESFFNFEEEENEQEIVIMEGSIEPMATETDIMEGSIEPANTEIIITEGSIEPMVMEIVIMEGSIEPVATKDNITVDPTVSMQFVNQYSNQDVWTLEIGTASVENEMPAVTGFTSILDSKFSKTQFAIVDSADLTLEDIEGMMSAAATEIDINKSIEELNMNTLDF